MTKYLSGNEIRKQFIEFFTEKYGHKFVPSSSLVPGGDATLLFTNAGMVQFKDVFLGTDNRNYTRAVNSQKCLRVAGKHNDLEDVGFDDTHHTFFEMLGNWSFGDYYKKEAIEWAWELLTEVWEIPTESLYVSVFKDEQGQIPTDEEAASLWLQQPNLNPKHLIYLGRKDNFWEMADTGPCGPNSEIHIDRGPEFGELTYLDNGQVDLDGPRFLELWNLVFIIYNRTDPDTLEPLASKHIDTGMGFERIVSVLQNKDSNYRTDLFWPLIEGIQEIAGTSDEDLEANLSPYRVIADHIRAAAFLIADGVIPGNVGRNYVTRMIIRRAARFGTKIGLDRSFLAFIAEILIASFGDAYPELAKNKKIIMDNLTREEEQFAKTIDKGMAQLENLLAEMDKNNEKEMNGEQAFDLYATYGLPMEITRDILSEKGYSVDEAGFKQAVAKHRLASGGGKAMGEMETGDVELYMSIFSELVASGKLTESGVKYNPYGSLKIEDEILTIVANSNQVANISEGQNASVIIPENIFYIASGGQVSDIGTIVSPTGKADVLNSKQVAAGVYVLDIQVTEGKFAISDIATAEVNKDRRQDIIRNHTATHLLHAELQKVLGEHAKQAGSLVAPDRLRFDFNHPQALTREELDTIEKNVNDIIIANIPLQISHMSLDEAKADGAAALFGEKYGEVVRTIKIEGEDRVSFELCGGTHVESTGEIGTFIITSEGSAAAGIRRIEAVSGTNSTKFLNEQVDKYLQELKQLQNEISTEQEENLKLGGPIDHDQISGDIEISHKEFSYSLWKEISKKLLQDKDQLRQVLTDLKKENANLRKKSAGDELDQAFDNIKELNGISVLAAMLHDADRDTLRDMADKFRQKYTTGAAVIATIVNDAPALVATLTKDLVAKGWKAGDLVNFIAEPLGGKGGGPPHLAQAGGKTTDGLEEALERIEDWIKQKSN